MKVLNKKRSFAVCQHINPQDGKIYVGQVNTASVGKYDVKTSTKTFKCTLDGKVFYNCSSVCNNNEDTYFIITVSIINSWPHLDRVEVYQNWNIIMDNAEISTNEAEMFLSEIIIKNLYNIKQNDAIIKELNNYYKIVPINGR